MKIQVLGSGCATCKKLFELTKKAVSELGLNTDVEYITDVQKIVAMGLMQSPVLVVNDKPVLVGFTSDIEKIKNFITNTNASNESKLFKKSECSCDGKCRTDLINKKNLTIVWQRLIIDENTCPRCGSTEEELNKAVLQLKEKLNLLGVDVSLEKIELTLEEFKKDPQKSNRILLNGHLLEDVISAKTGKSQCCNECGDEKCRTIEYGDKSFEIIPAELIVKAGLRVLE